MASGLIVKEIVPGIFQIRLPLIVEPGHVFVYLLKKDYESYMLIDAGPSTDEAFRCFIKGLSQVGIEVQSIDTILITHLHYDHYGGAEKIRNITGAKIIFHEREVRLIDMLNNVDKDLREFLYSFDLMGENVDEMIRLVNFFKRLKPPYADIVLKENQESDFKLNRFNIILTPGHTPGHICLYDSKMKIMISGDHVLPLETPNISYYPIEDYDPLNDYLISLDKIKKLKCDVVLPSHGYTFKGLSKRIDEIINHHKQRLNEIVNLIGEPKTVYEIASKVSWSPGSYDSLSPLNKWLALLETRAHLEYLLRKNIVKLISSGGKFKFLATEKSYKDK